MNWFFQPIPAAGQSDEVGGAQTASLTEAGSATDNYIVVATFVVTITASGTATATQTAANTTSAALTETGAATAAQTAGNATAVALTEAGAATATQVAAFGFPVAIAEPGSATDTVTTLQTKAVEVAEAGAADATQTVLAAFAPVIAEAGTATATQTAGDATSAVLAEIGAATDSLTASVSVIIAADLTEAGTGTDSQTAIQTHAASISEFGYGVPVSIGTVQNKTSAPTTVITTTATVPAGALSVVCITPPGDVFGDITSVADSAGNSYSLAVGLASAFTKGDIYYKENAAALASGGTITITWAADVEGKAATAFYVEGIVASSALDATGSATSSGTTPSVSTSADTSVARVLTIGTVSTQGPSSDTFTQDASPAYATPPVREGTSGGTAGSNRPT